MARILLTSGKSLDVQKEQAHEIWYVYNLDKEGTPEQVAFCQQIERIWLNLNNAPDSYIEKNLDAYIEHSKREWLHDYSGKPSKPFGVKQWAIAKRWGFEPQYIKST